jgi:hypothetical protein
MLNADYQQQQQVPLAQQQHGWQQHQQSHMPQHKGRAAGLQCADNTQHEQWQGLGCAGLEPVYCQHTLQQQQQQQQHNQQRQQRWDDEDDLDSVCGGTTDYCRSDISTVSCNAEIAAALAAARQRMGQNSTPTGSRHSAKTAITHLKSPASRKAAHAKALCSARQLAAAAAGAKGSSAANLAALATATLKKLELLSAESPIKQWR